MPLPPPAPAKPAAPAVVVLPVAQPEPSLLLPDPPARLAARSPLLRSVAPVLAERLLDVPDSTLPLARRWVPQELRPFDPLGVQYGSFLFRPAVEVTRGYDTNPARTMPASGSWYYITAPQLLVNSNWSRHELTATLRGSYTGYDTANQLNRPLVDTKVNGRIDVTSLTRIDLEGPLLSGHRFARQPEHSGQPAVVPDLSSGRRYRRNWTADQPLRSVAEGRRRSHHLHRLAFR